ncbi:MAG: bicyclomycin/multidrug efflux system [Candidatus Bathyarchaeota archaeon BA2]|nr:MAG: bicyclomycin/multidrug efflux system [Candidatus Bathyarchaeota archaeon BA2]
MESLGEEGKYPRYRWAILFASFYAFVAYAFALQAVPPLISSIKAEFNIPLDAEAALLMSIVLMPGIFLGLPAGFFVKKYGIRHVGFLSLVCVVLGCFVSATANSFIMLLAGRLILGVGGAFIVTNMPVVITQWFTREELGKVMGIYGINMPLATIIALPSASVFMLAYGWRFPFYVGLAVGITAVAVFMVVIREGPFAGHKSKASVRQAIGNFEIWKVGLVWLFFNAAALSFTTWAPELFETYKGMPKVYASFLASLLMWGAVLCVPIFGWLSDITSRRRPFAVAGSLLMTLTFVALAYTSNMALVASILALGITAALVPPIASALPAEILGPTLASVGFGITGICMNLGAASAQPLFGFLLDVTDSYTFCLLGMAALSAIGALVAYTLKTN